MKSRWNDHERDQCLKEFAPRWGEDLALRVYTSRLIGSDPDLVLHGGGNTSVKGKHRTLLGDQVDAIWVKGSGWDLGSIEPAGFPAIDLAHLLRLRKLDALGDEDMVNELRTHLFDASAPNPSVEALLHAFLPHRFIDHTHADAALALTNLPEPEADALVREAFPKWGVVPYVMPGFALARLAALTYERDPSMHGLVLLHHGLFTFSDDARESYERMIEGVDRAERVAAGRAKPRIVVLESRAKAEDLGALAPALRGALAEASGDPDRPWRRVVLEHRESDLVLRVLAGDRVAEIAGSGPLTPDHVIRTKARALLLRPGDDPAQAIAGYRAEYDAYFAANAGRSRTPLTKLDSTPRVVLVPGVGLFAAGRTKADARIAADIAEHTLGVKERAFAISRYTSLPDGDLFDVEYWSLEQAKLGKAKEPPLAGQVALVTGAAGAIGFAVARKLVEAGASVVLSDLSQEKVDEAAAEIDPGDRGVAAGVAADVTRENSVAALFREACRLYGGVDVVVPSAGVAHVSRIEDMDFRSFRNVVEVNLLGTLLVLRESASLFRRQGTGGSVVVISTKNVFAPGAEFGAYSASKAGAHQLARVAAIEFAPLGVRVNQISVDAVFGDDKRPSGLWQLVGPERARSRGIDPADLPEFYRKRNLLGARVTGRHVGAAVVFFASGQTPTTGASLPVDGGLPDASPR